MSYTEFLSPQNCALALIDYQPASDLESKVMIAYLLYTTQRS